jgi:hypothetical protein
MATLRKNGDVLWELVCAKTEVGEDGARTTITRKYRAMSKGWVLQWYKHTKDVPSAESSEHYTSGWSRYKRQLKKDLDGLHSILLNIQKSMVAIGYECTLTQKGATS